MDTENESQQEEIRWLEMSEPAAGQCSRRDFVRDNKDPEEHVTKSREAKSPLDDKARLPQDALGDKARFVSDNEPNFL